MEFSSILFVCFFFPIFYIIYYLLPKKYQNYCLLIGSLLFLTIGRNSFIWYFIVITITSYIAMSVLSKLPKNLSRKKITFWFIILLFIIWYLFIKRFQIENYFYYQLCYVIVLLQNISSLLDFYRNKRKLPKRLDYITYSAFFPKLLLGPVLSYFEMEAELKNRLVSKEKVINGFFLFLRGLFINVLLVGNLLILKEKLLLLPLSILNILLLSFIAMIMIILWFMSYSKMSVGLSLMLGFTIQDDFPYPLDKKGFFLDKWHISIIKFYKENLQRVPIPYLLKLILLLLFLSFSYGINPSIILFFFMIGISTFLEKKILKKSYIVQICFIFISFITFVKSELVLANLKSLFQIFSFPFSEINVIYYCKSYFFILICSTIVCFGIGKKLEYFVNKYFNFHIIRNISYFVLLLITLIILVTNSKGIIPWFRI